MVTATSTETRTSEQGTTFDVATIRGFLLATLGENAVGDELNDLIFEHVKKGRYHPSVIAENLRPMIDEILNTATREDWQYVADTLIAETRPKPRRRHRERPMTAARLRLPGAEASGNLR